MPRRRSQLRHAPSREGVISASNRSGCVVKKTKKRRPLRARIRAEAPLIKGVALPVPFRQQIQHFRHRGVIGRKPVLAQVIAKWEIKVGNYELAIRGGQRWGRSGSSPSYWQS